MDPSSAQHHQQEMATQTLESMMVSTKAQQDQKKPRPQPEQALKCPRCDSTNTKFCYYNNYSLSQPRYFCKSCRRYWTKGGTLRNVPVGGGCRKSKRSSSSANSRRTTQDHQSLITGTNPNPLIPTLPPLTYDHSSTSDHHHLGTAFARLHKQLPYGQLGFDHDHGPSMLGNPSGHFQSSTPSFFDALKSGLLDSPHVFSNLYYGMGNGNLGGGGVENGGEEIVMPYEAVSMTTMKQEMCNGREGEKKVLWGFPWQLGGDGGGGDGNLGGGGGTGDLDSGRDSCWNGIGSTWHGLLNSPLM